MIKHQAIPLTFILCAAMAAGTCLAADPAKPATAQAALPDPKPVVVEQGSAGGASKSAPQSKPPASSQATPAAGHSAKPAGAKSTTAAAKKPAKLVEINSASFEQLKTVPGIGDVEATRIIKNRPYTTRSNLVSKGAISYDAYFALKDYITVIPPDPKTLKK